MTKILLLFILLPFFSFAQNDRGHHLFNPASRDSLDIMTADRPDATESPFTVPPGHFQVEADLVFVQFDEGLNEDVVVQSFSFLNAQYILGIVNHVDVRVIASILDQRSNEAEDDFQSYFMPEYGVAVKFNLLNRPDDGLGLAVFPYVTRTQQSVPDDDKLVTEYGVNIPFAIDLNETKSLGLMGTFRRDDDQNELILDFTAVTGTEITESTSVFLEGVVTLFTASGQTEKGVHTGLTYTVCENIMLDAALFLTLADHLSPIQAFTGFTFRL